MVSILLSIIGQRGVDALAFLLAFVLTGLLTGLFRSRLPMAGPTRWTAPCPRAKPVARA